MHQKRALWWITAGTISLVSAYGQAISPLSWSYNLKNLKTGSSLRAAFGQVSRGVRDSVVSLSLNGTDLVLGTIIDADGLALSKSSELRVNKLKAKLADGKVVDATVILRDADNDVALLKLAATGLKPIEWAYDAASVGQWAITQGVGPEPEAVGIVSTPSRRLTSQGLLGVGLDMNPTPARIASVTPGFGAQRGGLLPGDVVLAINNGVVRNSDELMSDLRMVRPGDLVRLRIDRDGTERELEARVLPFQGSRNDPSLWLTQAQQAAIAAMNDNLAPMIQSVDSARASLGMSNIFLQAMGSAMIQRRIEELRESELAFAMARADEAAKLQELGIDARLLQTGGRGATQSFTDAQQEVIAAMNERLLSLGRAATNARAALAPAQLFVQPMDQSVVQAKVEALAAAELALAQARVAAMAKLQNSKGEIFPEQIPLLVQQSVGGFRAGRGGGRGGGDRQAQMNRMGTGVSVRADDFEAVIQHDTVLEPFQCGGPLVNLKGEAIGLNIARNGRVATYALPAELVLRIIDDLKEEAGLN